MHTIQFMMLLVVVSSLCVTAYGAAIESGVQPDSGLVTTNQEIASLADELEDQKNLVSKLQKQIKELQTRVEELEEELANVRQARAMPFTQFYGRRK